MKKRLYKLWSRFLTFFGDIKIFKFPMWVVYDPFYFKMTGAKILEVLEMIRPGDVILRGYDGYLDSQFINGDYSHGAVYVGNNMIVHAVAPSVTKIHAVEFMECDRIAVYRPKSDSSKAVDMAEDFVERKIPYDFDFSSTDSNALYCFELAAKCFPDFSIPTYTVSKIFGLVKKDVYLAKSFKNCDDFELMFEFNPKKNIDYRR